MQEDEPESHVEGMEEKEEEAKKIKEDPNYDFLGDISDLDDEDHTKPKRLKKVVNCREASTDNESQVRVSVDGRHLTR